MFTEVIVLNQDNSEAIDSKTGLKCKRRCTHFTPDGDNEKINVYYKQWLVGLDGSRVNVVDKHYFVSNISNIYYKEGEVITPAILYSNGEIISEEIYYNVGEVINPATYYIEGEIMSNNEIALGGELKTSEVLALGGELKFPVIRAIGIEVKTPAVIATGNEIKTNGVFNFNSWKNMEITNNMVGLTLEQLFVNLQINPRLKYLPIDVGVVFDNN